MVVSPLDPKHTAILNMDLQLGIVSIYTRDDESSQDEARFDEYEIQVREEYSWVPGPLYRRGRRKILQEFVTRQSIYSTEYFRDECEARARSNIARSLARL